MDPPKSFSNAEQLLCLQTRYTTDTVEWCPVPEHTDILAIGGYELIQGEKKGDTGSEDSSRDKRVGNLALYKCSTPESSDSEGKYSLVQVCDVDTHGILDMKWHPGPCSPGQGLVATAQSSGEVVLYKTALDPPPGPAHSGVAGATSCAVVDSGLCLALDWNCIRDSSCPDRVVVSDSSGCVTVLQMDDSGSLRSLTSSRAHSYEAWTAGFDYWNPNIVYSGGDDARFCRFDIRQMSTGPTAVDKKSHEMGVCCVQSHPLSEHLLLTGSYDEHLKLWDDRRFVNPLQSFRTGGGVWRVKPHPFLAPLVLVSNMYDGFKILAIGGSEAAVQSQLAFHCGEAGQTLSYAADWRKKCRHQRDPLQHLFCACTFYDRRLFLYTSKC